MRKVILSVLVTLTVVAFTFSGCKKSQPTTPTTTTPRTTKPVQPTTEKPAVPPVEKPAEK
jgi:PBP1b-binding outer membrane lipoprotein LpoB